MALEKRSFLNYDNIHEKLIKLRKDSINFIEKSLRDYDKEDSKNICSIGEDRCAGCYACYNICPTKAIKLEENTEGFMFPKINSKKCIDCGKCKNVCPILNNKQIEREPIAYAIYNKNEEIRLKSSSGGIFSLLAEEILNENGVVYGATFDSNFKVRHVKIDKRENLYKLRSSKYIQSRIEETYKECAQFLNQDKKVLFTGTPCQINALKSYLKKEYKNLYTQDIICHGVPSDKVWYQYMEYRKKVDCKQKNNEIIKNINFRSKSKGWNSYSVKFKYANNVYEKNHLEDLYMQTFLSEICLRKSCYHCNFKGKNRASDITLADFWGINKINKSINDNKGISLMLINSEKGNEIFNKIKENCEYIKVDFNQAISFNISYSKSSEINKNRDEYFSKLEKNGFLKNYKEFVKKPINKRIIIATKKYIKRYIK